MQRELERSRNRSHPSCASVAARNGRDDDLAHLGELRRLAGEKDAARSALERALQLQESQLVADHPQVVATREALTRLR